jgi:hypothetical protein
MARVGMHQTDDPLEALRARIRATADAADRLAAEASAADAAGAPPPPADEAARETQALVALVEMLRDLLPPELRRQINDLIRQVLMLIRAILDWWVDRLEPGRPAAPAREPDVEDIPLD